MVKFISKAREKFMDKRDKHGLKMGLALKKFGKLFKVKKHG